jgi:hypothetical protein
MDIEALRRDNMDLVQQAARRGIMVTPFDTIAIRLDAITELLVEQGLIEKDVLDYRFEAKLNEQLTDAIEMASKPQLTLPGR